MEYRRLGNTDISVSVMAFGSWGIGGYPFWSTEGDSSSTEAIEAALESGINFFDTAPVYGFGHSERLLGRALKNVRDEVVIATKCGLRWKGNEASSIFRELKPSTIRVEVEESLRRLETDYIDLYQIHWPSPDDPIEPAMEELAKLKDEGKIRAIGVSNFDMELLRKTMTITDIASVQPKYNMLEKDIEKDILPFCGDKGIGVIVYSPLASGLLTGKYARGTEFSDWRGRGKLGIFREEVLHKAYGRVEKLKVLSSDIGKSLSYIAINWVLANPAVTSALIGVKNAEQMKENTACLAAPLAHEEMLRINEVLLEDD